MIPFLSRRSLMPPDGFDAGGGSGVAKPGPVTDLAREGGLALALEASGAGVWDRNVATGEIHYSPAWKAMFGYAEADVGKRIEDSYGRVHPDDLAMVQASIEAHFRQETSLYSVQYRILCKDGAYKWILSRGKVASRDADGRPLRMTGITHDISEQVALSERLRLSVELITRLTDGVPGLVYQYRLAPDGRAGFPHASAGIATIYELDPEQVRDDAGCVEALIHPDDLDAYRASLAASADSLTRWQWEYRVNLPLQGLRWRRGDAQPSRLPDGATLWHGFISDVTEHKRIEQQWKETATTDFLTGLPNRRHFMASMDEHLARIRRDVAGRSAVLMFDLDLFKVINDTYGHATGDLVLQHFAAILRQQLRQVDAVGRIGGEEFAVILPGAGAEQAQVFARRVQARLEQAPLADGARVIAVRVSIGIAAMRADDAGIHVSLQRADQALYLAKERGRNRVEIAPQ